jgi:DNA polymerase
MNARRDMLLDELGLTPVWRLRSGGAAQGGVAAPVAAAVTPMAAEPWPAPLPAPVASPSAVAESTFPDERTAHIARMDWPELRQAVSSCTACGLHKSRNKTVFGVGDEKADWMLIGEAPGAEEDARGEPFVGQAGQLLDSMLWGIGLTREQNVFISNVLKCRPPGNRNPDPSEVAQCGPHLLRQIRLVEPRLILAMGRFAVQTLLGTDATIASLRGKLHSYHGVPLVVTYHPAYLLRTLADKSKAWEDLCLARKTMRDLQSGTASQH